MTTLINTGASDVRLHVDPVAKPKTIKEMVDTLALSASNSLGRLSDAAAKLNGDDAHEPSVLGAYQLALIDYQVLGELPGIFVDKAGKIDNSLVRKFDS